MVQISFQIKVLWREYRVNFVFKTNYNYLMVFEVFGANPKGVLGVFLQKILL